MIRETVRFKLGGVRRKSSTVLAVLLLVLLVPAAAATSGELEARSLVLPESAAVSGPVADVWLADTSDVTGFAVTAPHAHLEVYELQSIEVRSNPEGPGVGQPLSKDPSMKPYELQNVTITLIPGRQAGWAGIQPSTGATHPSLTAQGESIVAARPSGVEGNDAQHASREPDPDFYNVGHEIGQPYVEWQGTGGFTLRGSSFVKLVGLDVDVRDATQSFTLATGQFRDDSVAVHNHTFRWASLWLDDATLLVQTRGGVLVAFDQAQANWDGMTLLDLVGGTVDLNGASYAVTPGQGRMSGSFQSFLAPSVTDPTRTSIQFSGDIASASFARLPPSGPSSPLGGWDARWLILGVGLVVGGAGAAVVTARIARSRREGLGLEELVELGNIAAEDGRFGEALDWVRRARKLAPTSESLAIDEGFFLESLGMLDEAALLYQEASRLEKGGEGDFALARLAMSHGGSLAEAETRLVRALQRQPTLVYEIDETFAPLRRRPGAEAAIGQALSRARAENA